MSQNYSNETDQIRNKVDLVELVGHTVKLKRYGKHWKGLCPFHDDHTPSFQVSSDIGRYRCWSCGAKGDAFDWVMKTQNVDFPEALEILAKSCNVVLTKQNPLQKSNLVKHQEIMNVALEFFQSELTRAQSAKNYCKERSINETLIQKWSIGYAPDQGEALAVYLKKKGYSLVDCSKLFLVDKDRQGGYYDLFRGRLMFPIFDERGRPIAFGGRIVGAGQPKYINSSDTPLYSKKAVLYGFHLAKESISQLNQAILVEGYLDVVACHQAGLTHAVASLGTALTPEHAKLLRRWCEDVIIMYDPDSAGSKASESAAELLIQQGFYVRIAKLPKGKDPAVLMQENMADVLVNCVKKAVSLTDFKVFQLQNQHQELDNSYWRNALDILVNAEDPIEFEKHLLMFAGQHPELRDLEAAKRALRKKVESIQSAQSKTPSPNKAKSQKPSVKPLTRRKRKLDASELALFQALLSQNTSLRKKAWEYCLAQNSFLTQSGLLIAVSIKESFPNAEPSGELRTWSSQLNNQSARELLEDLAFGSNEMVNLEVLEDAIVRLKKAEERRSLTEMKSAGTVDDAKLAEIHARLQKMKAEPKP